MTARQSINLAVTEAIGQSWNPQQSKSTVEFVRQRAPAFVEQPPRGVAIVANGIIKLTPDGRKRFHEGDHPELLTPVRLPVKYDPNADCPTFDRFLKTSLRDKQLIRLLQEVVGYLIVPDTRQQKAFLNKGIAGGGKSTFIGAVTEFIGKRNCSSRTLHDLVGARFATYDLYGKLLNASPDLSGRELGSSAMFRAITSPDPISAEQKHQPSFMYVPFARLLFSANKYPTVADPDQALFDRWIVIPWEHRFRGTGDEDKSLAAKLAAPDELSGILNWALIGLQRLLKQGGFSDAKAARQAMDEFELKADLVRVFLDDEADDLPVCVKPAWVERELLWLRYQSWCRVTEHSPMGRNKFYDRMRNVVPESRKGKNRDWCFDLG